MCGGPMTISGGSRTRSFLLFIFIISACGVWLVGSNAAEAQNMESLLSQQDVQLAQRGVRQPIRVVNGRPADEGARAS